MITLYACILVFVGFYFFFLSVVNGHKIHSETITEALPEDQEPLVSVLIPARNEENNIGKCLDSFLNQTYKNYEILVLDDNSTDKTHEIVESYVKKYPGKVQLFSGKPLPEGWRGKSYAMKQLTEYAKGEYYLFTDADTVHTPDSVSLLATNLVNHNADMISGYLRQEVKTFGEKITVPLTYMMTSLAFPLFLNDKLPFGWLACAIGQFIGVKAESFKSIGGYERIKNITTEDMYLARTMKKAGFKTMFLDFKNAAACRMYTSYDEGVKGISKNVYDAEGRNDFLMFGTVVACVFVLFLPAPLLITKAVLFFLNGTVDQLLISLLFINVMYLVTWMIICITRKIPFGIAFLYPLLYISLLIITCTSWHKGKTGQGYVWKGRVCN